MGEPITNVVRRAETVRRWARLGPVQLSSLSPAAGGPDCRLGSTSANPLAVSGAGASGGGGLKVDEGPSACLAAGASSEAETRALGDC